MLINAGVNMPAPLGARASRPPGEAGAPISISMASRPLMVGAALAAALVLQPVSCMCKAQPLREGGWV